MKDIYWIRHDQQSRLAIVARPEGEEWLEEDLASLKQGGIDVLVSLLMPDEAEDLGLAHEGDLATQKGWSSSLTQFLTARHPQMMRAFVDSS